MSALLDPIAEILRELPIPSAIVRWGHPALMAVVAFVMGPAVALAGWQARRAASAAARIQHRRLAPWLLLFLAGGYLGGLLSLRMQQRPILESPHFWTGSLVLGLLGVNAAIALTGFAGDRASLRSAHALLGSATLAVLLLHAALGLDLGLAL